MEVKIKDLVDDEKCYETIRALRWPDGVLCVNCFSDEIIKRGKDDTVQARQRYECKACSRRFDDLTNSIFAGHHQPLKTWVIFLYFLGLNLSTDQIAKELDLDSSDAHDMASLLREGVAEKKPEVVLSGEVECDEVYIVAGHKGQPDAVKKKAAKAGVIA